MESNNFGPEELFFPCDVAQLGGIALEKIIVALLIGISVLTCSIAGMPHHGTNTTYDRAKTVVLKGTVTQFKFTNPHVQVYINVENENGKVLNWDLEATSVYYWSNSGWNKTSLKPGDHVVATINPARTGSPTGNLFKLVTAGGKEFVTETK